MSFDRLETLAVIDFIKGVIPNKSETGKNCLFVRVDEGKLILTGGGEYVTKRAPLIQSVANEDFTRKIGRIPDQFMIPLSELLAFREMLMGHKEVCKKLQKTDPNAHLIEITGDKMISHDGEISFKQPGHAFKDLETQFQIIKKSISETKIISADMSDAMTGFKKSKPVEVTFTGPENPIYFQQGDFEAIMLPYKETESEEKNDQTSFGDDDDE